jgi:hypothetical protein
MAADDSKGGSKPTGTKPPPLRAETATKGTKPTGSGPTASVVKGETSTSSNRPRVDASTNTHQPITAGVTSTSSRRLERTSSSSGSSPLVDSGRPEADAIAGPAGHLRKSSDLIYESIMRGGGEPFGEPYEVSAQTLTERIVRFFKQRGFFGFEFFERRRRRHKNKFTRYGSAPFRGDHPKR